MIVIDASVLVGVLLNHEPAIAALEQALQGRADEPVHAPELIDIETLNALRRMVASRAVDERRATQAVADIEAMRMLRYPHAPMRERVWELRHNLTAYDATYLALAEALDAELLTADEGLATAGTHALGRAAVHQVN